MTLIEQLARAVLDRESLKARAISQEIMRSGTISHLKRPATSSNEILVVAAALAELLASYAEVEPPTWTSHIDRSTDTIYLCRPAKSAELLKIIKDSTPEPLRKRNLVAPEGFLKAV